MAGLARVAIIGAGIAGLNMARHLSNTCDVRVFEKSRGIGGRMSTRRADHFQFDHGAQYFTAQGPAFRAFLAPYLDAGIVAQWSPALKVLGETASDPAVEWNAPRYVAVPGMNSLCKSMAEDVIVVSETRIETITRHADQWQLTDENDTLRGTFDWVVCTAPAEQTTKLMPQEFQGLDALKKARMSGCYSLMLGFNAALDTEWEAAIVKGSPLAWIAKNNSKTGRASGTSILCQSRNDWAERHIEDDQGAVCRSLCAAFETVTGIDPAQAAYVRIHKWRFAKVEQPAAHPFLLDAENQLAAAGDWCGAGRVEAGFDSAEALADALLTRIKG